jgi:hypothetical protein
MCASHNPVHWWAHHAITCINIELTFPKEEIEELLNHTCGIDGDH